MRILSHCVLPEESGQTVKRILRARFQMAEVQISRLKMKPDGILLNGAHANVTAVVRSGDMLQVNISDENACNTAEAVDFPLDFLYEDGDLAVLNKPAGMAVHGSTGGNGTTVANALAFRWGTGCAFHPVNRLDKGTSGLMVIAKSAYVHDLLRRELHTEDFCREYLALAEGHITPAEGSILAPIARDGAAPTKRCVSPEGLPSRTDYRVVRSFPETELLRMRPYTGRTHQIRVHMAHIGHPLLGDVLYGGNTARISRPALHSVYLRLRHPVSGKTVELEAPIPEDMASLMNITP